jgi:DNA invertase Pin-like site-specific DNA recombinase
MSTFFLYARKSSEEEDRQVASIGAQLSELRALAEARGIVIARVFEECQSARHPGRPVFNEMMCEMERHPVQGILCWKPDRLARNPIDGGHVIYALDRERLGEVVCPGRVFKNTSDDKLLLGLEFTMSKKYVDDLSDNVRRGNRAVLSSGRVPGNVPLGYLKEPPLDRTHGRGAGRTIPDPERFLLVRQVLQKFLTGTYTLSEIYRFAREDLGLRTRGTRRFPERPVSLSGLRDILSNPFYMGLIQFGGDVFPGDHEPVVTKGEFDQIQELLHRRDRPRPSRRTFAYRGLVSCACGRGTTAELHAKRSGLSFTYYRCSRRWKEPGICSRPFLSERALEEQVMDTLKGLTVPERFVKMALTRLGALEAKATKGVLAARVAQERELAQKDRELERLTTLCLRGALDEDEFVATKTRLLAERQELAARLAGPPPAAEVIRKVREVVVAATEAPKAFAEGTAEERRELVGLLCEKIVLHPDGVDVRLNLPFQILAGYETESKKHSLGANPPSTTRFSRIYAPKRVARVSKIRVPSKVILRMGANSPSTKTFALDQRKNRALFTMETKSDGAIPRRLSPRTTILICLALSSTQKWVSTSAPKRSYR